MKDRSSPGKTDSKKDLSDRVAWQAMLADACQGSEQNLEARPRPLNDIDANVAPRKRLNGKNAAFLQGIQGARPAQPRYLIGRESKRGSGLRHLHIRHS